MSDPSSAIIINIAATSCQGICNKVIYREHKRLAHVQLVKSTKEYAQWCGVSERPLSPDPWDRSISKRTWDKLVAIWRGELRKAPRPEDCCDIIGLKDEISSFLRECRERLDRAVPTGLENAHGDTS